MPDSPSTPLKVAAVVNPIKKRVASAVSELEAACLSAHWPQPEIVETTVASPGFEQAKALAMAGADIVVALGGDGTVRQAAYGLAGTDAALAIMPLGTANLFARNIGLRPGRLDECARVALHGRLGRVDLGLVEPAEFPAHPFLVVAGIGHDAATVQATQDAHKERFGWPAYLWAGVRNLFKRPLPMTVRFDDGPAEQVDTWTVLAGNCGKLPLGARVFADAECDDGQLDVLLARVRTPLQWAPVAVQGFAHRRVPGSGLDYRRAEVVEVTSKHPLPVQVDGDVLAGLRHVRFRVKPEAFQVRLP